MSIALSHETLHQEIMLLRHQASRILLILTSIADDKGRLTTEQYEALANIQNAISNMNLSLSLVETVFPQVPLNK